MKSKLLAAGWAMLMAVVGMAGTAVRAQEAQPRFTYVGGGGGGENGGVAGFLAFGEARREGDIVIIPSLAVPDEPTTGSGFNYASVVVRFDCKARTGQIQSGAVYDVRHKLLMTFTEAGPVETMNPRDPVDQATIRFACGEEKPGADNPVFATAADAAAWARGRLKR